jgi:hypothetical protein
VTWELIGSLPLDPEVVGHLPAPKVAEFEDSGVAAWRRRYRFGSLYWRNGGRFALIRDQRHGDVRRMRLEGDLLRMFLAAVEPLHLGNVAEAGLPATAGLVRAGLVLEHGGWLLALPIRLIRWPVPYDAIYA